MNLKKLNLKEKLEKIYLKYNKKEFIHPDPLEFLYNYKNKEDIEIAGLLSSCLAYGNVHQIIKHVQKALNIMGKSPFDFIKTKQNKDFLESFSDFKYRFTEGYKIANLIIGIKQSLDKYGSLNNLFLRCLNNKHNNNINIVDALNLFAKQIVQDRNCGNLLPFTEKNSACKRLNLFLRWMVRQDNVDLGCWTGVSKSQLIIPLDTHMHRIALNLEFTKRKQANLATAIEITENFKKINPEDPVKYDFCLTRLGIIEKKKEDFLCI